MKANLKGQGGVKGLLLLHGEKLGMAIVGICAALFVYSSLGQQRLGDNYTPDNLRKEIRQAKQEVDLFQWDQAPAKGVAQELADIADIEVKPEFYAIGSAGWNPPVMRPTVLRTDPLLLPAEGVEAHGGSGLLAFADENVRRERELQRAAEQQREEQSRQKERQKQEQQDNPQARRTRGEETGVEPGGGKQAKRRPAGGLPAGVLLQGDERVVLASWACVVAKVPIKDQLRLYRDAFENARGHVPESDFPSYEGFFVERAEVRPEQELHWESVDVYDGKGRYVAKGMAARFASEIDKDWADPPQEVVSARYLDDEQALVFPLPPLVGRDWGQEVTHPDIPLASAAAESAEGVPDAAAPDDVPAASGSDLFGAHVTQPSDGRRAGPRLPRGRTFGPGRGGASLRGGRGGYGPSDLPDMSPHRTMTGRGSQSGRAGLAPDVTHWLLRFFDFNVEPGRKYKYRVQIVLSDPNQDPRLEITSLDPTVLNRLKDEGKGRGEPGLYRRTDWSQPSATVSIPQAGGVRIAGAKAPSEKLFNDEPRVNLLVDSFDVDEQGKAIQAQKEKEFRRGYVANMKEDAEILVDQGRSIEETSDPFKFHTGITVLDIGGGDRFSRELQQPGRVLLMDAAGQLSIRNELDDAADVERYRTIFAEDDDRRSRGGPADDSYRPAAPGRNPERMMRGERFERGFER